MKTKVVNIKNDWEGTADVYVGRGSIFGNPYTHLSLEQTKARYQVDSREESIEKYKEYFYDRIETDEEFLDEVLKLHGKVLGCFCKPKSCHADVIVEFLNKLE